MGADRSEFFKTGFGQSDQPFDFNAHAGVHESRFRKNAAQDFALTGITAVKRTQGGKRGKCLHRCLNKRKEAQYKGAPDVSDQS